MSDLISRTKLLKCFSITKDGHRIPEKDCDNFEVTVSVRDIKRIIKEQPTAYDVDAVVEYIQDVKKNFEDVPVGYSKGATDAFNVAIATIRKGGGIDG